MVSAAKTSARRAGLVLVLGVVIVSGLCSGGWWFGVGRGGLDAELAALRARGEPASVAAESAATDDGAAAIASAHRWLDDSGLVAESWPALDGVSLREFASRPYSERRAARAFVDAIEPFLDHIRRASENDRILLPSDPHVAEEGDVEREGGLLSRTSYVLRLATIASWRDDDPGAYLEMVALQARLAAGVVPRSGHETIGVLELHRSALLGALEALSETTVSAESVRSAVTPTLDADARALFSDGLRWDRARLLSFMRRVAGDEEGPVPAAFLTVADNPWRARSVRAGAIRYSRAVDAALDAAESGLLRCASELATWPEKPNVYWVATFDQGRALDHVGRIGPPYMLRDAVSLTAMQRIYRVAHACVDHREASGAWPSTLDSIRPGLAAEDLVDPFTDDPLSVEFRPGSVRIASAGTRDPAHWESRLRERHDPERDGLVWTLRR